MTPIAGFFLAVIAGWMVRDARRAAAVILVPFLAVLAIQTYGIADGRGVSPPSTVTPLSGAISYYVFQVVCLALVLGIALEVGTLRRSRELRAAGSAAEPAVLRRRTRNALITEVLLTGAFLAAYIAHSAPVAHHSSEGSPPLQGVIGIGLCLATPVVLGVLMLTGRRAAAVARRTDGRQADDGTTARVSAGHAATPLVVFAVAGAAVAALAVAGGTGRAAAAPLTQPGTAARAGGTERVYDVGTGSGIDADVFAGAFTDHGKDHIGVFDHGMVNKIVLSKGSFRADLSVVNARTKVITSDNKTCLLVLHGTGPVALSHGTGAYRGIHGSLKVTVTNVLIFARKSGKCDTNMPLTHLTTATGSGRISF